MQQIIDKGDISPKKKDTWLAFGIVLCVIFANEVDGMEWRTLIDGNREAPRTAEHRHRHLDRPHEAGVEQSKSRRPLQPGRSLPHPILTINYQLSTLN